MRPQRYSMPAYQGALGNGDGDDEYEERDLADYLGPRYPPQQLGRGPSPFGGSQGRHFSYPAVGGYPYPHAAPPRSAYSSPPPMQRGNSLEVGSVYSAPGGLGYGAGSSQGHAYGAGGYWPTPAHGSYGEAWDPHGAEAGFVNPAAPPGADTNEHFWYRGAPPSVASSRTMTGSANGHGLAHPPSLYPGSPEDERPPAFFGVDAPHHRPGGGARGAYGNDVLPSFPAWSRTWYGGHLSANGHGYTNVPPSSGQSGWETAETLSRSAGGPPGHVYGQPYDPHMTDFVKEERMRMLEKEFGTPKIGGKGKGAAGEEDESEEEEEEDEEDLVVGSVDKRGKIVSENPKWTLGLRWAQGLTALAAFACGIGGALLSKPGKDVPAPKGKLPSFVLYGAATVTLLVVIYLLVLRPCCCDPARKLRQGGGAPPGAGPLGGLVVPVVTGAGGGPGGFGKKNKGGKGGPFSKKNKGGPMGGGTTVNLIVDPALLGGQGGKGDDDDDDEEDGRLPGAARRKRRKRGLGVLGNMALQARWQVARKNLKLFVIWDAILFIIWVATEVVALGMGKTCKPGTGGGWCDWYNAAIASGAILAAILLALLYFDWRDLKVSRRAPKPRI